MIGFVISLFVVILLIIFLGYGISIYNSLIRLKHNIEKAWSNIEVLLRQRNAELTKLMNSVKGYMKFERKVLTEVTKARTAFLKAKTVKAKAVADNMMSSVLKSIFAVAEAYPKLRSSENFMQFQNRISEIEDSISDRREFYNDSVNTYNIRIHQIPYVFVANMLSYTKKELFKANKADLKDVEVKF